MVGVEGSGYIGNIGGSVTPLLSNIHGIPQMLSL